MQYQTGFNCISVLNFDNMEICWFWWILFVLKKQQLAEDLCYQQEQQGKYFKIKCLNHDPLSYCSSSVQIKQQNVV